MNIYKHFLSIILKGKIVIFFFIFFVFLTSSALSQNKKAKVTHKKNAKLDNLKKLKSDQVGISVITVGGKDAGIVEPPIDSSTINDTISASFPGGDSEWRKYLYQNFFSDKLIASGAPPGNYKIVLQFWVDESGYIKEIKDLTNVGFGIGAQTIKLLKNGPKWMPATINGRAIKSYRELPITIEIAKDQ
ncbi:MAG: hypothetical protein NVS3B19_18020 [Ginsengibacter sp.]